MTDSLAVSYKAKNTIIYSNHVLWYLLKSAKSLYAHKNLHMKVYNNLNHKCQKNGSDNTSFNR